MEERRQKIFDEIDAYPKTTLLPQVRADMVESMLKNKKLANKELATFFNISEETLEKVKETTCLDCGKVCNLKGKFNCLLRGFMKEKIMYGNR